MKHGHVEGDLVTDHSIHEVIYQQRTLIEIIHRTLGFRLTGIKMEVHKFIFIYLSLFLLLVK